MGSHRISWIGADQTLPQSSPDSDEEFENKRFDNSDSEDIQVFHALMDTLQQYNPHLKELDIALPSVLFFETEKEIIDKELSSSWKAVVSKLEKITLNDLFPCFLLAYVDTAISPLKYLKFAEGCFDKDHKHSYLDVLQFKQLSQLHVEEDMEGPFLDDFLARHSSSIQNYDFSSEED